MWRDIPHALVIAVVVTLTCMVVFGGGYLYLRNHREARDADVSAAP